MIINQIKSNKTYPLPFPDLTVVNSVQPHDLLPSPNAYFISLIITHTYLIAMETGGFHGYRKLPNTTSGKPLHYIKIILLIYTICYSLHSFLCFFFHLFSFSFNSIFDFTRAGYTVLIYF